MQLSREKGDSSGFVVVEKFVGLLALVIGAVVTYNVSISSDLQFSVLFSLGGIALMAIGLLGIFSKTE